MTLLQTSSEKTISKGYDCFTANALTDMLRVTPEVQQVFINTCVATCQTAAHGSQPSNDMTYEAMSKYDAGILKCTDYYSQQCAAIKDGTGRQSQHPTMSLPAPGSSFWIRRTPSTNARWTFPTRTWADEWQVEVVWRQGEALLHRSGLRYRNDT